LGDAQAARSAHVIDGSADPALYQSLLVGLSGYRLDQVPNGVYAVELRFAVPEDLPEEPRVFDVIVEDELVLAAHDPAYRGGPNHADEHTFYVPVRDGQLDIRFSPRTGQPMLSALRVTHRPDL
jgi:hypothetical protein